MKIVIDMNLSPAWVDVLANMGHPAQHWSSIGEIDAEDSEIMAWARQHQHVVFTHDLDYGALLYTTQMTAPSVVQLRSPDVRPSTMSDHVRNALELCHEEIQEGALISIFPHKNRVSMLPLKRGY